MSSTNWALTTSPTRLDSFVQGTGLGLNICRIIADQMHGTVKVDTTYTAGARLVFSIPL
ncbi:MAG: ATP-binding protein [Muribaculaceae bacterium]